MNFNDIKTLSDNELALLSDLCAKELRLRRSWTKTHELYLDQLHEASLKGEDLPILASGLLANGRQFRLTAEMTTILEAYAGQLACSEVTVYDVRFRMGTTSASGFSIQCNLPARARKVSSKVTAVTIDDADSFWSKLEKAPKPFGGYESPKKKSTATKKTAEDTLRELGIF